MASINIERAYRLKRLPPYLFAEIDRMKAEVADSGMDIISLGIGDPDLPTPDHIIEELDAATRKTSNHQYPSYEGMPSYRKAVRGLVSVAIRGFSRSGFGGDLP